MKKILKNNQKTEKFLNKLPKIYLVVTWAHAGYREYPFSGKHNKEGIPLVYFYDDHNGTSDNYYLIPITDTTTGFIDGWTFSAEEAEKRVEELDILEEERIKLSLTLEKEEEMLNNIGEKLKQQKPFDEHSFEPHTKDECFELICGIAYDYDGYRDAKNLMELIDEIKEIAEKGWRMKK